MKKSSKYFLSTIATFGVIMSQFFGSQVVDAQNDDVYDAQPLIVATKLEPSSYNINYTWDGAIPYINANIMSKLVAYNDFDGELYGDLATDWSNNDDLTEYTFSLNENVEWHDGELFNAEDVVWTVESILEEGSSANGYRSLSNVDSIEAVDDYTVTFYLNEPSGVFVQQLADYYGFDILPSHLYSEGDPRENPSNRTPIGTGPFKFVEHVTGSHVLLEANHNYHGDGPYIQDIVFQFVPSESTALTSIEAGDADAMTASPAFAEVPRLENLEHIGFDNDSQSIVQWIGFNVDGDREYITDPIVREAIIHAIDNDNIAEKLYLGMVDPAESWYASSIEWADNLDVRQPDVDIDYANQLLDDAGYEIQDDGYRFTLTYRAFDTSIFGTTDIPIFVQEDLEKIGININYERFEWALRTEMLDNRRDWDIAAGGGDRGPDPMFFKSYLQSNTATNKMLYDNPKVDELFKLGETVVDLEERAEYYHEIQEIISQDIPMYNIVEYSIPRVYNNDFTGFHWQEDAVNSANHMYNSVKRVAE